MPLQNRVDPSGTIVATAHRGTMMGNRGGRIHDPKTKSLTRKLYASKRWICCVNEFKQRQRTVMGESYTELFFLDEITALASGHRPCFECRRNAANDFAARWQSLFGNIKGSVADGIDKVLHAERLPFERTEILTLSEITNGTAFSANGETYFKKENDFLCWSFSGYKKVNPTKLPKQVRVLTPPSIRKILADGYEPVWHPKITLQ